MRLKAEIFDKVQYLYEETKFNDHQLHCVIKFQNQINIKVMKKTLQLLFQKYPILNYTYVHNNGDAYWENNGNPNIDEIFHIVDNENDFQAFTNSKIDEQKAPQMKVCLLVSSKDSISIIMNHMVCDAAGFKQCIYEMAEIYSKLIKNPKYIDEHLLNGDRSMKVILSELSMSSKLRALLIQNKESNQKNKYQFPFSEGSETTPFILTREIDEDKFIKLKRYSKLHHVTINDVILTAYYRVLFKITGMQKEQPLNIPIMIDMRKYKKNKKDNTISNFSSTVNTKLTAKEEKYEETLDKISSQIQNKKERQMGTNGFIKLRVVERIFAPQLSNAFLKKFLNNPVICMTNIGVLDSKALTFAGSPVLNAFMCGSIKYRPHFQMAVSSFANKMTLSCNIYGDKEDYRNINSFLEKIEKELPV